MILLLIAAAVAVVVLASLAIVVAAIRQEPRGTELGTRAPSPMAAMVRRLLGLSVRRLDPDADDGGRREACLAGRVTGDGAEGGRR
jgi:hypothetical protein